MKNVIPILPLAILTLLAACKEETVTTQPPGLDCICARACGVPVVGNAYWVNAKGDAVALGYCPVLNGKIIRENRASCQCAQPVPGMGTLPQSVPNG